MIIYTDWKQYDNVITVVSLGYAHVNGLFPSHLNVTLSDERTLKSFSSGNILGGRNSVTEIPVTKIHILVYCMPVQYGHS